MGSCDFVMFLKIYSLKFIFFMSFLFLIFIYFSFTEVIDKYLFWKFIFYFKGIGFSFVFEVRIEIRKIFYIKEVFKRIRSVKIIKLRNSEWLYLIGFRVGNKL